MGTNAQIHSLKQQLLNAQTIQIALQERIEQLEEGCAALEEELETLRTDNGAFSLTLPRINPGDSRRTHMATHHVIADHWWGPVLDAALMVIGRNFPMASEEEPHIIMGGPHDGKVAIARKFFMELERALTNLETFLGVEAAKDECKQTATEPDRQRGA